MVDILVVIIMMLDPPSLFRSPPVMLLIVNSITLINELTDDFNYGTRPDMLFDHYDFIIGEYTNIKQLIPD